MTTREQLGTEFRHPPECSVRSRFSHQGKVGSVEPHKPAVVKPGLRRKCLHLALKAADGAEDGAREQPYGAGQDAGEEHKARPTVEGWVHWTEDQ